MISIVKQYRAEIAHRLHLHPGLCRYVHGHSYLFEIQVVQEGGDINPLNGMVADFKHIKEKIEEVIGPWDHSLILYEKDSLLLLLKRRDYNLTDNATIAGSLRIVEFPHIPTAENMAKYIGEEMSKIIPPTFQVVSVRVWETTSSFAEWSKDVVKSVDRRNLDDA